MHYTEYGIQHSLDFEFLMKMNNKSGTSLLCGHGHEYFVSQFKLVPVKGSNLTKNIWENLTLSSLNWFTKCSWPHTRLVPLVFQRFNFEK